MIELRTIAVGERKSMKALLCAVVLALLPSGAFAMSGREYLDHCARMTVYDRAQCMGYLDAILRRDTGPDFRHDQRRDDDLVEVAQTMRPTAYCLPTSVALTLMRDFLERLLGGRPATRLHNNGGQQNLGVLGS